jgi:beta-glucosidase-like glycosyl hydrolase
MSRAILTDLLRGKMGYEGVIITDGMDMHAIAHRYGAGQAAVNALVAGADMVMAIGSRETQEETLDAIAAAIADGTPADGRLVQGAPGPPRQTGAGASGRQRAVCDLATTPPTAP